MDILKTTIVAVVIGIVVGGVVVASRNSDSLGSLASPDIPSKYISIGGARLETAQTYSLQQATNTVLCSLQSPSATSTLIAGGVTLTSATSGASSLSISKSSAQWTVDTLQIIATTSVASGAYASLSAASSTFNSEALSDRVFAPNTYMVIAQQGAGVLNQTGSCSAIWSVI